MIFNRKGDPNIQNLKDKKVNKLCQKVEFGHQKRAQSFGFRA